MSWKRKRNFWQDGLLGKRELILWIIFGEERRRVYRGRSLFNKCNKEWYFRNIFWPVGISGKIYFLKKIIWRNSVTKCIINIKWVLSRARRRVYFQKFLDGMDFQGTLKYPILILSWNFMHSKEERHMAFIFLRANLFFCCSWLMIGQADGCCN